MGARNVAIIGCGAIGGILAKAIDRGEAGENKLGWLFDLDEKQAKGLAGEVSNPPGVAGEIEEILKDKEIDLVVEAASQEAVSEYATDILESGKDLMVLSIGAFSNDQLFKEVSAAAKNAGQRVYLPSGAILGLDGLKAVKIAGIDKVSLTTRKPPGTLATTKFVEEQKIDLSNLREPKVIFEGTAREAVEAFPESVNVAATLSLATIGFERTKVKVVADPSLDRNVHQVRVKGEAGEFTAEARNVSSPENPKTSYLAALSAIQELRDLTGAITIGT